MESFTIATKFKKLDNQINKFSYSNKVIDNDGNLINIQII